MASATILSQPVLVQPRPTPVGSLKTLPGGGPPPSALSATPQPGPARAEPKKPAVECQHLAGLLASSSGDRVLERYRQVVKWGVRERLSAGKGKERANVGFATRYVASLSTAELTVHSSSTGASADVWDVQRDARSTGCLPWLLVRRVPELDPR